MIAEVDAPLERALPYLYLHFKNSKYLEPLGGPDLHDDEGRDGLGLLVRQGLRG